MPTPAELAWLLSAGAFTLFVGLTSYLAKRDRQAVADELSELSRRVEGLERSLDAMRKDIHQMLLDHERRITRLEVKMESREDQP